MKTHETNVESPTISRRDFVLGGIGSASALAGGCRMFEGAAGLETDPDFSVFISDIHCSGENITTSWGAQPTRQNKLLSETVDEILALRPRPKRVVVFGDVALWFGYAADYDVAKRILDRITAAGIDLYVTTGNHDHREPLFAHFPRQRELTPVPGRVVSVIDLGQADLLLLDTLDETGAKPGDGNRVGGALDDAQWNWLQREAKARTRPFFCGGHHAPNDLNGREIRKFLCSVDNFVGWIHGHDHKISETWFKEDYAHRIVRRTAVLPSTGWWGDIGYGLFHTSANRAVLSLVERDFFFPEPLKPGEVRPAVWDTIKHEHTGRSVTFDYVK